MSKQTPEQVLMEKPIEFEVGGEKFIIDSWTMDVQTEIFTVILEHSLQKGISILKEIEKAAQNPAKAISPIMKILGPNLKKIYALTLGKNENWVNKNISMGKNIQLFRIIWIKNEIGEQLKNFPTLTSLKDKIMAIL